MSHTKYCAELLRKYDHSVFLSTLFLPQPQRSLIWAIRAMNVELAHIQPKERHLGKIRFEWWKQAISDTFEVRMNKKAHE
jgi:phytoene/squalene synthetase